MTSEGSEAERTRGEATLGGGCFWCIEAVLRRLEGIDEVVSDYAGGHLEDPTYEEVCSGETGHAEVVRVRFDPRTISYRVLLEVFFTAHDPTTRDRQGPDVGPSIARSSSSTRTSRSGSPGGRCASWRRRASGTIGS